MSIHGSVESPAVGKVLGLNTPVKVGLRVQLTEKGKAGFDEQMNELAGPDGRGWITTLMNDGLICAVRWDKNPEEEHFYRTGEWNFVYISRLPWLNSWLYTCTILSFSFSDSLTLKCKNSQQ